MSKYFGGLKAVDDVDIAVRRGGVHALIGPNGSGKTTTLNVLSGLYKATAGKVLLDGTDVTDMPPHQRAAAGLGRTFQNIRLFRSMTALENVVIGAERPGNTLIGEGGDAALTERAMSALTFVGLGAARQRTDLELLLRPSAADRDRARARRQSDPAAARRARGRIELQREARAA